MQTHAIIVAGGSGSRMQANMPKQYMLLQGKPMLLHSLDVFLQLQAKVIIVVHPDFENYLLELLATHNYVNVTLVHGGATRFESVRNGIFAVQGNAADVVLVHDAARPFINTDLVKDIIHSVSSANCVVPVISIYDSIRLLEGEKSKIINRDNIKIVQTPQAAFLSNFQIAFGQAYSEIFTDEASVCEAALMTVTLVNGLEKNIKITTTEQLHTAQNAT